MELSKLDVLIVIIDNLYLAIFLEMRIGTSGRLAADVHTRFGPWSSGNRIYMYRTLLRF
jgi:hypothetical protein